MLDKELVEKAKSVYSDMENALREAVENRHYDSAEKIVKALRKLQFGYGGGVPMSQGEDKVLDSAIDTMVNLMEEPLKYQMWENVAYCANMLAAIESVLTED